MNPKKHVLKFIQRAYSRPDADPSQQTENTGKNSSENEIIRELFDGMSTGTARIIIEREVNQVISEKFSINTLENKGRYYIAKIVRPDGSPIQSLLVDKQTGSVQMIGV
jgi:hypothetical protein